MMVLVPVGCLPAEGDADYAAVTARARTKVNIPEQRISSPGQWGFVGSGRQQLLLIDDTPVFGAGRPPMPYLSTMHGYMTDAFL